MKWTGDRAREAPQRYEALWSFDDVLQNVKVGVAREHASWHDICASSNAGKRTRHGKKNATATTNCFDLIMETRKVLDWLPISFSHRHVPAHQDISREEMDIWGRANGDCDTDAKAFWKEEEASGTLVTSTDLCDEWWSLWIQGEKLSSNVKRNIYNSIHDPEASKNWGLRDLEYTEGIDVPARRQAAKSSNIPRRI
jgi:hypothetical protein